jgi:hypothetical protein
MSSTWSVGPRWRRLLPWTIGALAFIGLVAAYAPQSPAQAKKGDAKKAAKATKDSKEADDGDKKEEARPAPKIPQVVDIPVLTRGGIEQIGFINEQIAKGWRDNKVQPASRCTDYEFIRRASLDIIGRIPTVAEIDRFMKDDQYKRRSLLIDRLLDQPPNKDGPKGEMYSQNFANLWTIMLMTRTTSGEVYREQMHDWLTRQFISDECDWSKVATELISASGETNRNAAVNFVLTHLGEAVKDDKSGNETGVWDMVPVTSRTTRLFLGIRTQCVQCHDHPFNAEWGQHNFWGINAFFRQVETNGRPNMMAKKVKGVVGVQQYSVKDNPNYNVKGVIPYERRNAIVLYTDPAFLFGEKIAKNSTQTRRQELANFITKSPYFAKSFVNRMWGHFMGKSFTKDAVDDFGEHNPVSHADLLDRLAKDWAEKYNHNPKVLIRWICNSQAYGLATTANKYNDKPEDEVFFGRMLLKPMTPEQLFESLMTATESKIAKNKEELKKKKREWLNQLIVNFGNDEGEEGGYSGTVVQALLLMNGQDINAEIMAKDGTVAYALATNTDHTKALTYLYKAALSRPPSETEAKHILSAKMRNLPRAPQYSNDWKGYYEDVFWALLNSNEFILNH